jgi:hypothetical protein
MTNLKDLLLLESPAAEQAKKLQLTYAGYGRWKDRTGTVVAKSVDGGETLASLDPAQRKQASQNNEPTPAHLDEPRPDFHADDDNTSRDATTMTRPGASNQDLQDLENEPENDDTLDPAAMGMKEPNPIRRLIARAGGDTEKLRKALVKRFHNGDPKAQKLLALLDAHEGDEVQSVRQSLANLDARKKAELAARKQKYAQQYPSPQI